MKVRGQIIRILDNRTVIINLGREDGINDQTVFRILGRPEEIVDPLSNEKLGSVTVVKSRVKSQKVYDKFTIAGTSWTQSVTNWEALLGGQSRVLGSLIKTETVDEGELLVEPKDVQPWRAQSESPVSIGDNVETEVPSVGVSVEQAEPDNAEREAERSMAAG